MSANESRTWSVPPTGRAYTPEQKRTVIERVLRAWLACPSLRLGQLLDNAVTDAHRADMFNVEDVALAEACERFTAHGEEWTL